MRTARKNRNRVKKGSKAHAQRVHAFNRCAQRNGVLLTDIELESMCKSIRNQEATFIKRQSNRVTIWDVDLANGTDKTVRVVYDKRTKQIVTFLPEDKGV